MLAIFLNPKLCIFVYTFYCLNYYNKFYNCFSLHSNP
uniref:Uncharacterized protein n=1 Tax=Myoviridae sp. ctijX18 TaxID=2825154 RepID=A0A8S5USH6_9CAUD|nr:MAG TPA: hypothetical protein [Myoviridae sp. ctijX18]DAQ61173.1 MAG TPA: hypothetical protein [Caudoviricetes sp.]